jgi:hypothetical protein
VRPCARRSCCPALQQSAIFAPQLLQSRYIGVITKCGWGRLPLCLRAAAAAAATTSAAVIFILSEGVGQDKYCALCGGAPGLLSTNSRAALQCVWKEVGERVFTSALQDVLHKPSQKRCTDHAGAGREGSSLERAHTLGARR